MLVLTAVAVPAFASQTVYLRDGGRIKAKSVWRSHGRVYVLATRDTLTDFSAAEIDMKRTFVRKRPIVKKHAPVPGAQEAASPAVQGAASGQKKGAAAPDSILSKMPKIPEKTPESLVPSSGAGGTIKQHKKEMAERAGE